jgi:hypothetical protein
LLREGWRRDFSQLTRFKNRDLLPINYCFLHNVKELEL